MILERFPEVAQLPEDEKWQLMAEIEDDLFGKDPATREPLKSQIVRLLEARMQHYREYPETASSWEEVSRRMLAQKR
jgi:putative addiction module component (TIGR02574 family)